MFYIPPMLFFTMGSLEAYMRLDPWAIGTLPGDELDDEVEAAERMPVREV